MNDNIHLQTMLTKSYLQSVALAVMSKKKTILIFLIFILIISGCKRSNPIENSPPGIDPGIVFQPSYDSPIWYPNGKFIGFNHTHLTGITFPYGKGVNAGQESFSYDSAGFWLIDADGTNMRRIFPHPLWNPAWSPDGQWIAFDLAVGEGVQIFKMRFTGTSFDTTSLMQLTYSGRNFFPAWKFDGLWITYDRSLPDSSGTGGIWVVKTDNTQHLPICGGAFPSWYPKGDKIIGVIGTSSTSVWTKFVEYNITQNTTDTLNAIAGNNNQFPKYSLDGSKIAFWSNSNIWIMDTTGKNQQQLTTGGVDVDFGLPFSWSPDGVHIVYTSYQPNTWNYGNGTLWIINANTGIKKQLSFNLNAASKGGE